MRLMQKNHRSKGRLSVRVRMDLTADDLAMVIAGLYLRRGLTVRSIPADYDWIAKQANDALALYGMDVAAVPGMYGYEVVEHEALTTFVEAVMNLRRDENASFG